MGLLFHKKFLWLSVVISLGIVIISFFYSRNYLLHHQLNYSSDQYYQRIYQSLANGILIGAPNASNTIIIYESLLCSGCANFSLNQLPDIINLYVNDNRAKIIIYPMPPKETMKASLCAWREGKILDYEKYFFQHQKQFIKDKDDQEIISFAQKSNLDLASFKKCYLDKNKIYDKIIQDWLNQAQKDKVQYTPTIIVNGKKLIYNGTDEIIDQIGEEME
ncbi:MAG TPA: hypothetical protein ENL06_01285 [Candidatus Portnoybacteria bacterium]|nr:hypothetical protein [Candidatus Portnoybacteria bacterium]